MEQGMSESGGAGAMRVDRARVEAREFVDAIGEELSAAPPAVDDYAADAFISLGRYHANLVIAIETLELVAEQNGPDETMLNFMESFHKDAQMKLAEVRAWSAAQAKP